MDEEHYSATEHENALALLTSQLASARDGAGDVEAMRDRAVRRALQDGIAVKTITDLTGLSRARVYQIRDGRR